MSDPTSTNPTGSGPTAATDLPEIGSARMGQLSVAVRADPEQIGPYRILERVGEGGMGLVFKAEQREPVRRTVALKLIRWGMDSEQILARFDSERQALALMDHPNVARVLDAGMTDGGRPYFVMEFVAGEPITAFCDRLNYTTAQRLELFVQACEAVQHAHQKALIHRDLKPSNILVTHAGDKPLVKVIDFGMAKALTEKLTEHSLHTTSGQLLGTPEYMSPEQAEGSLDIDTRTDVYALGVVLYELLCGALPFDPSSLRSAGFGEIQRIIRDVEPPRPSAKLSSLGGAGAAEVARRRQAQVPQLAAQLRRELEWVPLKAMHKDRTRRYATADQLADDVRNYLAQRPLLAGPETLQYRARKFVRRNRGGVVAVTAVAAALLIGGVVSTILAVRLKHTADEVRAEQQTTQAVLEFVTDDMLAAANPEVSQVKELSVRQALDNAAAGVAAKFAQRPLVEAAVRNTLAQTYCGLGRADAAEPHARAALEQRRRLLGDDHPDTLQSVGEMGYVLQLQGRFAEAEPLYREALEGCLRVRGDDHPDTLTVMGNLGSLYWQQGKVDQAEPLYRRALEGRRRVLGDDHHLTLEAMDNLALVFHAQVKPAEAEALLRESLERSRRVLGSDHVRTQTSISNLGTVLQAAGKLDEAEPLLREAVERGRRVFGDDHPSTLVSVVCLATLYESQGNYDAAEPLVRDAAERFRRVLGDDHPDTIGAIYNYGALLRKQGKHAEAEPLLRLAVGGRRRIFGEDHPGTLNATAGLAYALMGQGKLAEAEPLFAEVYRRTPGARMDPKLAANLMCGWGLCLDKLHRYAEAGPVLREAERRLKEAGLETPDSVRDALARSQTAATQPAP